MDRRSARWVYGLDVEPKPMLIHPRDIGRRTIVGEKVYPPTNPVEAGQTYIESEHLVLANSSAAYHGKKVREASLRL